jgi:DivIVA domain-containing protein
MQAIFEPDEIALKTFVIRWRGYDTREVETFLRAVAVDFRRLLDHVAAADQQATPGDQFAEVRDELNRLSSRLDGALAGLEEGGLTEPVDPSEPAASTDHDAVSTDSAGNTELLLVCGGSGGG